MIADLAGQRWGNGEGTVQAYSGPIPARVGMTGRRRLTALTRQLHQLLRAHDPGTAAHALRVRRYARVLARALGLPRPQRVQLDLAAQMHDLGKVAVPVAVLTKPGALTPLERRLVELHPTTGADLLTRFGFPRAVVAAVRSHHERFDGHGYPDGLRGYQIPLLARILSVADCFDALTGRRSYRQALAPAEALAHLREDAGSHFDPELVTAFLSCHLCDLSVAASS